jgi:acetyl esterase/lipase
MWGFLPVILNPAVDSDIIYSRVAGEELKLDVHYPAQWVKRPAPAIVMIHGGAWVAGKRQDMNPLAILMARNGFVVANISYRLAPKHKYPAFVDDAQTAVRFVRANAAKYGIDPNRIGSCGASAGGHMAIFVGFRETRNPKPTEFPGVSSRVQAIFDFFGPTDMSRDYPPSVDGLYAIVLGKPKAESKELVFDASPFNFIDLKSPPLFVYHGTADQTVPIIQSKHLEKRYAELGLTFEKRYLDGVGHEIPFNRKDVVEAVAAGISFMKRHLSAP